MATHFSILAWNIPWTEEPGRLQSMGSQESDTTERLTLSFIAVVLCLVAQSCPTLFWDCMNCSPSGFSAHGISQARILEWVVISFSRVSSQSRD